MIKSNIQLKSFVTGPKKRFFKVNIDDVPSVLIGHIQSTESMDPNNEIDPNNNINNFYDLDNNNILHNLYLINDFNIRSRVYAKIQSQLTNTLDDYVENFAPNENHFDVCQFKNYCYTLTKPTLNSYISKQLKEIDSKYYPTLSYTYDYVESPVNTYIYPPSSLIETDIDNYVPIYNLSGFEYNFFMEFDLDYIYPYFEDNEILGNALITKNAYNQFYSMDSKIISTNSELNGAIYSHSGSGYINNTRRYTSINSSGDDLYLTYYNDINYLSDVITISSNENTTPFGTIPNLNGYDIINIPLSGNRSYYIPNEINSIIDFDYDSGLSADIELSSFNGVYTLSSENYNNHPMWELSASNSKISFETSVDTISSIPLNNVWCIKSSDDAVIFYNNLTNTYIPKNKGWIRYSIDPNKNEYDINISYKMNYKQYENVEFIKSINRFKSPSGHKSSLYSINIQNSKIDSSNLSEASKNRIKKGILNIINNITKNVTPIHTQLFNVYFTGE